MATSYKSTQYGGTISHSKGKFRLKIIYTAYPKYTTITPILEVTNAFSSNVRFEWKSTDIKKYANWHTVTHKVKKKGKGKGKTKTTSAIKAKGSYTMGSNIDCNDNSITIWVRAKEVKARKKTKKHAARKGSKASASSSTTINYYFYPAKPSLVDCYSNVGNDISTTIKGQIYAYTNQGYTTYQILRRMDESNDLTNVLSPDPGNIGGENNGTKSGFTINYVDNTLGGSAGKRMQYVLRTFNGKTSDVNTASSTSAESKWMFTTPPPVSLQPNHIRVSNTQNTIIFDRTQQDLALGYIQGYIVEYNTANDGKGTNWKKLFNTLEDDITYDSINDNSDNTVTDSYTTCKIGDADGAPLVSVPKRLFWASNPNDPVDNTDFHGRKHAKGMPTDLSNILRCYVQHLNCETDTSYSYRVRTINYTYNKKNGIDTRELQTDNAGGLSTTEVTYNTPAPPESISAIRQFASTNTLVTITKSKNGTADVMFIERKVDDNEYVDITGSTDGISIATYLDSDGQTIKYTDDTEVGGTNILYRVKFANSTLLSSNPLDAKSGYLAMDTPLSVLTAPAQPTNLTPYDKSYAIYTDASVQLEWQHSPLDGTAQTAAQIQWRYKSDTTWADTDTSNIISLGNSANTDATDETYTDITYDFPLAGKFAEKDCLEWRVRTKGNYTTTGTTCYSPWSKATYFNLYGKPQLSVTFDKVTDALEITSLPLNIAWEYIDNSGTLKSMKLIISQNGRTLYSKDIDITLTSYKLSDYLFDNGESYNISLAAVSSTTLAVSYDSILKVNYRSVKFTDGYGLSASFNKNTGIADLTLSKLPPIEVASSESSPDVTEDVAADDEGVITPVDNIEVIDIPLEEELITESTVKAYIYRIYRGESTLVGSVDTVAQDAAGTIHIIDKMCPVNEDFEYQLLQIGATGAISIGIEIAEYFETLWWYIIWGVDNEVVKTRWNPSGSSSLGRPNKQQIRYSGRKYPVSYDTSGRSETYSYTADLFDTDEYRDAFEMLNDGGDDEDTLYDNADDAQDTLAAFRKMMEDGGQGIWKTVAGDVYKADFDFSYSVDYTDRLKKWTCNLSVVRIDEED